MKPVLVSLTPSQRLLSLRLGNVLDTCGASEKMRHIWREAATTREILSTIETRFIGDTPITEYTFGSSIEGTTTPGLRSDLDQLFSFEDWLVLQDLAEYPLGKEESLLMVTDEFTKPGYAKLQLIIKGEPQTSIHAKDIDEFGKTYKLDNKDRIVVCRRELTEIPKTETHGPADTLPTQMTRASTDMVQAYRCLRWPDSASEWLQRTRQHNWPAPELLNQLESMGFFLVPVGHPLSNEKIKEWRISLSLQERFLMFKLNPTQHKCYIVMKMIKQDVLFNLVGESSLSSYHIKTCIFYMVENTPDIFWVPENLLACIHCCLSCLNYWAINWVCPNYFLPAENMFDGRLDRQLQQKLASALQTLLSADFKYLPFIQCDNLGLELKAIFMNKCYSRASELRAKEAEQTISLYCGEIFTTLATRNIILYYCIKTESHSFIENCLRTIHELHMTEHVTEHSKDEIIKAVSLLVPMLEVSLLSNMFKEIKKNSPDSIWNFLTSPKWLQLSDMSNCFTARLKQATLMLVNGYGEASLELLYSLRSSNTPAVVSACDCRMYKRPLDRKKLAQDLQSHGLTKEDIQRRFIAPCVVFLPNEAELIPVPLRYEMIRSVGTLPNSRSRFSFWFDWAVVDSKFLLHFLLYLSHSVLRMRRDAVQDIKNMGDIILYESNLNHKETDYNLMGWVFKQEGLAHEALECFKYSLKIFPEHNAAIWHLIDTVL